MTAEIRDEPLPAPGAGELLVETGYSGISRGTEALVAAGRVPASERERMRCPFQAGEFPFPVKYGYAVVGRVAAGPPALRGRSVFVLHPHQDRCVVPARAATPLPEEIPPQRAVLAANLETALNAVWDANLLPGDRVTILGAGVVGLLIGHLAARIPGTTVTLADPDPAKRGPAAALGCAFAAPDALDGEADVVIEASGQGAALARAVDLAAFEGTVLAVGWYGSEAVALPLGGAFHSKRLRLIASQVGAVSAQQRPRWNPIRRMAKVVELLRDPALDVLLTGESRFADLPASLPPLLEDGGGVLCHRVRYE